MMKRCWSWSWLLLALSACSADDRQILVVLLSDFAVPAELDRIEVSVRAVDDPAAKADHTFNLTAVSDLPLSFGIAPLRGDPEADLQLDVAAFGPAVVGYPTIRRRVDAVPPGVSRLPVMITESCTGLSCELEQTCLRDTCQSQLVSAAELDVVEPGRELEGACIPGRRCTDDGKAIEICATFGQGPTEERCALGRSCDPESLTCVPMTELRYTLNVEKRGGGGGEITSAPGNIRCPSRNCSDQFLRGVRVTLTANPDPNSTIVGWGGDCVGAGANPMCELEMSADRSAFVEIAPKSTPTHSVQIQIDGPGSVSSNFGGLACPGTCQANYPEGTILTLTAAPEANATFAGWSGVCENSMEPSCQLSVDAAVSATARFTEIVRPDFELRISRPGASATWFGVVSSMPTGIDCGPNSNSCSSRFFSNTTVHLEVQHPANTFAGILWKSGCTRIVDTTCEVDLTADTTVEVEVVQAFPDGSPFDLNADGFDDLILGAPGVSRDGLNQNGAVYIKLGPVPYSGGMNAIDIGSADHIYSGAAPNSRFGDAILLPGDLNGDGFSDLVVSAPLQSSGAVHIILGGPFLPPSGRVDANPHPILTRGSPGVGGFGRALVALPDLNGDGRRELAIGAPGAGEVRVFHSASNLGATPPAQILMGQATDRFGEAIVATDLNCDGRIDLIVGAPRASMPPMLTPVGRIDVFAQLVANGSFSATPVASFAGPTPGNFGEIMSAAAELGGELAGCSDLAIGVPSSGYVHLIFGNNALPPAIGLPDQTFNGPIDWSFGSSLLTAFDYDNDQRSDLWVGVPMDGSMPIGAAHRLDPQGAFIGLVRGICNVNPCPPEELGVSLGELGDLDGDSYRDLGIGAHSGGPSGGAIGRGRVVIMGSASLRTTTGPPFFEEETTAFAVFLGENQNEGQLLILPRTAAP